MHVAIIGSGPTGLFLGAALARRGHRVTAVDRDGGPDGDREWRRRGVMQFHHAHGFRPQIVTALQDEIPEALDRWLALGAEPITFDLPDGRTLPGGMRSRRQTFERALRAAAVTTPGLELRRGHVEAVSTHAGRADGLRVDGLHLPADLVVDASGRAGRVTRALRGAPELEGATGTAYVDRQYRLLPGAEPGPLLNALAWQADLDGYQVIIFMHERGIFSVLVVRPSDDADLALLRHPAAFEAACRAIPGLAEWTDPQRSRPITPVLAGGALVNRYHGQAGPTGRVPALPGLVCVGDAVCTTTPTFGRGITTSLLQARELLRLLDEGCPDITESFDAWCGATMRPWVADHLRMDGAMRRRWAGEDVDLTVRLPSDLIMAAAQVDARIGPSIGAYMSMTAGPECLDAAEPLARAVYRTGWRPSLSPGPSRTELAALVRATARGPLAMAG